MPVQAKRRCPQTMGLASPRASQRRLPDDVLLFRAAPGDGQVPLRGLAEARRPAKAGPVVVAPHRSPRRSTNPRTTAATRRFFIAHRSWCSMNSIPRSFCCRMNCRLERGTSPTNGNSAAYLVGLVPRPLQLTSRRERRGKSRAHWILASASGRGQFCSWSQ